MAPAQILRRDSQYLVVALRTTSRRQVSGSSGYHGNRNTGEAMFIHVPQASKNARELSDRLVEVVREAKKNNKSLNYLEVCHAFRLTGYKVREELGGMSARTQMLIFLGILVALMVGAIAVAMLNR
jgi:hypothetical protein